MTSENYYISINDMLVGILFLFILLLTTYALSFKSKEDNLNKLYKERVDLRSQLVLDLRQQLKLPPRAEAADEAKQGILRFDEQTLFEPSRSDLKPQGHQLLSRLGTQLAGVLPCFVSAQVDAGQSPQTPKDCRNPAIWHPILEAVYIEGHTDSSPYSSRGGNARTNWELSSERAIAAYRAITGAGGDGSPKRRLELLKNARGNENLIGISGYADRRKIDFKHDAPNRRVDLRFVLAAPSDRDIAATVAGPAATVAGPAATVAAR